MRHVFIALSLLLASTAAAQGASGAGVYSANCAACHQATGKGVPGAFPPLAAHVPDILAAQGGRAYLVNMVLYGLQGQIRVNGQNYSGAMPGFAQLSDAQLAAVLNHVSTSWGNKLPTGQKAFTAADVKVARASKKTSTQVATTRPGSLK